MILQDFGRVEILEVDFHSAGRAGGDTGATGDALFIVEQNQTCLSIDMESANGAYGDASTAARAFVFITSHVLAKRLDFYACFDEEINSSIVFSLVALELQYEQPFLFRRDGCLKDVELEVKVFHQFVDDRPINKALGKAQHYFF